MCFAHKIKVGIVISYKIVKDELAALHYFTAFCCGSDDLVIKISISGLSVLSNID